MKVMVDSNILIFSNIADMPEYPLAREKLLALIDQGVCFCNQYDHHLRNELQTPENSQ